MIRWLSLFLLFMAPVAIAQSDTDGASTNSNERLPTRLDAFLNDAIDEGLLVPTEDEASEGTIEKPTFRPRNRVFETANKCSAEYPYDFTDFRRMQSYQDLYPFQEAYRSAGSVVDSEAGNRMAMAFAALNMSSELRTMLRGSDGGQSAVAMGRLIALLDAHEAPDMNWFRTLSDCHPEGEFWLAIALLISGEEAGVDAFDQRLTQFRKLPLEMRVRLAGLIVPILNTKGERVLVSKVMADFTAQEVETSSQLRFAKALINLDRGSPEARETIQSMASQPRFQEIALEGLLRSNISIEPGQREILLREAQRRINRATGEDEIAASLRFTLQELSSRSRYSEIIDLLEIANLQAPFAQNEIRRNLVDTLDRDLDQESSLRALAAMDLLLKNGGVIDGTPGRDALFQKAVARASDLGFQSLAEVVAGQSGNEELALNARVELSLVQQRHEDVLELAAKKPDYERVQLAAAHAAIALKNKAALTDILPRLATTPSALIGLLEADAAAGTWYLPQSTYALASQTSDDVLRDRIRRVSALKSRAQNTETPTKLTLADAGMVLSRSLQALPGLQTEIR